MRRFWGRNDLSSAPRFSRDDDQLLALNYENLCDGDYLQKLFLNDPFLTKDGVNLALFGDHSKGSASSSESSLLNPEMAEDVMLFGDSIELGKHFFNRRLQRDLQQSSKFYDSVSLQISRQVMVFEHIALLMAERCGKPIELGVPIKNVVVDKDVALKLKLEKSLVFSSLACSMRILKSAADSRLISSSSLKAVIQVLLHLIESYESISSIPTITLTQMFSKVRAILVLALRRILSSDFLTLTRWDRNKFEEQIKVPLLGIFGLIALGSITKESDDMIVAMNFLSLLGIMVEARAETFIRKLKEEVSLLTSTTAMSLKNVPAKVSAHLKQQQISGKGPANIKERSTEDLILKQPGIALVSNPEERLETSEDNALEAVSKLQTHGSGVKLWEKTSAVPANKALLDKEKDFVKSKPSKNGKSSDAPKMLHEYLDNKEAVISSQQQIVVNYAMTEAPTAPVKSNNLSNNDPSPARTLKDQRTSSRGENSALSEIRRIEKEVKDSIQQSFMLPKTILSALKSYSNSISSTSSQTPASPGKKISPVKVPDVSSTLPTCSKMVSRVYSSGQNSYGELGLGDVIARKSFTRITNLDEKGVVSIGAGNEHSLFVTKDGKLLTAGYNDNGQCGVGTTQQVRQPTLVQALEDEEVQQVHVYNGCEHTIAVTKEGKVYSFGYNYRGQLGLGNTSSENIPRPIRALLSRKVVIAACSYHHTVILCSDGSLFSCGRNDSGQLGHGDTVDKKTPQAVLSAPKNIVSISCGQFHTVACTSQGIVYACGKNDYGQLGLDGTPSLKFFTKIPMPSDLDNVAQVCCGYYHTLVLSTNGMVGGFGRNDYGQLGLSHTQQKVFQCTVVNGLRDKLVTMVSAGCYHSVTVTVNGMLYVFGRNNHGQLATGDLEERHAPHPVDDFVGQQVLKVAAGFYHTIVLTTDHKQLKRDSQSYLNSLLTNEENIEKDFPLYDIKHLNESFRTDLSLLAGPEDCNINTIKDEKHAAAASRASFSSTDSGDALTHFKTHQTFSCRDLLTLLIKNMLCFSQKADASIELVEEKDALIGLLAVCSSLGIMLLISWEHVKGFCKGINIPVSIDDAMNMLQNAILITQRTLRRHRNNMMKLLGVWTEEPGKFSELVSALQSQSSDVHITELIACNFSTSYMDIDDRTTIGVQELKKALVNEFAKIRIILITIYSVTATTPKFRDDSEALTSSIARCLVQTSDICFGDPSSLSSLISTFSSDILSLSSTDIKEELITHQIRLLSALGSTLHQTEDVILLFRKSPSAGVQIYKDFLRLYMYFSVVCLDRRLQGHASSKSVDIKKILTVLELTVANISKCIFPLSFFTSFTLSSSDSGYEMGIETLNIILQHASTLLSKIVAVSLSDETLGYLRYGTLIPSLLPSILLYCITFVKQGIDLSPIAPSLRLLIQNLQHIGKFEINIARLKAAEKKQTSLTTTPTKDKDAHNESFVGSPTTDGKDDEINDASAEEILYMKREQHQISWWFRLLRLAATLSAKMVTLDLRKLRDSFCPPTSQFQDVWETMSGGQFNKSVLYGIVCHPAWRHLSWTRENAVKMGEEGWLMEHISAEVQSTMASAKMKEICNLYRVKEKVADTVYNMLSKSSQSMFSVNLLNSIEENLFECIFIGYESELEIKSKLERNFKVVSSAIKYIYSRRSVLVTNSGGLSWVEILLTINNIIKTLCFFFQRSINSLRLYHSLALPSSNSSSSRGKKLWRKALLVILCIRRWCNCILHGYRKLESNIVDLMISVLKVVTDDLTIIPKEGVIAKRLSVLFKALEDCCDNTLGAAKGINSVTELLDNANSITIKADVINSIAISMKEIVDAQEMKHNKNHISWLAQCLSVSDVQSKRSLLTSTGKLERSICRYLNSFLSSSSCTQIELQFIANAIRLMEILFLLKPMHSIVGDGFSVTLITKLQIFLHDKYTSWNNSNEERSYARKGATMRDRNFALKKCIFSLLSYSQAYAVRMLSPFPNTSRSLHEVLQSNLQLISFLQSIRYIEIQMKFVEENNLSSTSTKPEEVREGHPLIPTSLLPLLPASLSFSGKPKESNATVKKKFQDVITKPMEFCRNAEGIVIQGEKLMNNCKGMDFSIASWVYLKGRSTVTKTVMILGKISHNEAWPILLLKPDGKLEIACGTNNEVERASSEEVIPTFAWTHLAVVVEQKKIKLFINGNADVYINSTKGNIRATLFPLVLGGCPSSLRTRISSVKDGFDGMLAHCKYYSRALSPIHVKVIFDNGPPETVDISAKAIYHLLATTKALLLSIDMEYAQSLIHNIADACHVIFVTDTNKRNRLAALDLLQVILRKDCLQDLTLTGLKLNTEDGKLYTKVNLMSCSFCGDFKSFHSRIVCYLLRLAGWSWLPFISLADQPVHVQTVLDELNTFSPLSTVHRPGSLSNSSENGVDERIGYQYFAEGELSFHTINIIQTLLSSKRWFAATVEVVEDVFCHFLTSMIKNSVVTALDLIGMLSTSFLLGGVSSGSYLGSIVNTTYDDSEGRIVNINSAANSATILSNRKNSNDLKALKVRLTDLQFDDNHRSSSTSSLVGAVYKELIEIVSLLSPRIVLLARDFLAKLYPDSTFQQKSLLKYLRPIETLIFHKLLLAMNSSAVQESSQASSFNLKPLLGNLVGFASGTLELDFNPDNVLQDFLSMGSLNSLSITTKLWFSSIKYLESVSDKVISLRFPAESEERVFMDFLSKHMGISLGSLDQEHKVIMNNTGSCGESLVWLTANKCMEAGIPLPSQGGYVVSEKALITAGGSNHNHILDMMLTEQEITYSLQLLHYLRYFILQESRKALKRMVFVTEILRIPSDIMLWVNICPQSAADKEWMIAENIVGIFNQQLLWNKISNRIVSESMATNFTTLISTMIRYSGLCFLQNHCYAAKDNILGSLDFFSAFIRNLFCWVEFNDGGVEFESIACHMLDILLPALPYVENEMLEVLLLQLCVHTIKKLAIHILEGQKPSSILMELVRNAHFLSLRQIAQDQIIKYKNHSFNNISPMAFNYTQLVANMELIQRRGSSFDSSDVLRATTGSGKNHTNLLLAKIQSMETLAAKIVNVKSNTFEVDLTSCSSTLFSHSQAMEILQLLSLSSGIDPKVVVVEVALGVGTGGSDCIFETVYCGTSLKLVQSGLMPNCTYQMKCRAYFGAMPLSWSPIVEFHTEKGLLFSFDPLKCGPDVVLSEDLLTASYTGDDNWSTLLGSRSFSSGVSSWEIKVMQSSTAYLFIGVASTAVDLSTFLGGCSNSWGFIGEQALYHNREKVKVYGDAFSTGDIVGVTLDLNIGTLSFSKNGKNLGVAFDKIHGDLFPAVAFYNVGQELQIVSDGFKTSCAHEPIPISPARLSMDDVGLVNELLLSLYLKKPLSHRLAVLVAEHCNQWCTTVYVRCRAVSQKDIFLATESPLLKRFGLVVGERVRTYYGAAEVAGSAYNRIWFRVNPQGEVWFFTIQQIQEGRSKKLFSRCSYENSADIVTVTHHSSTTSHTVTNGSTMTTSSSATGLPSASYDASTVQDLLDPAKWTEDMDICLISFYLNTASVANVEAWKLTSDQLFDNFRALQQTLSRIVMNNADLLQKWGISGPKRKAVIARLGMLRALNQLLEMYFPFFISDNSSKGFFRTNALISDDFIPIIETFHDIGKLEYHRHSQQTDSSKVVISNHTAKDTIFESPWPGLLLSWSPITKRNVHIHEVWMGPFHALRRKIFPALKQKHFFEVIKKTTTRPLKTDDDYDYPENLPHVKINRLKSFRAREAAELMQIDGEDLLLSSMFCQLYKELRHHSGEKLRISYTHPMDDGQSRSFKIKFEGEGVDDYGGPYREIFQQICIELQLLYPGSKPNDGRPECFLPLLMPTPNWTADGDIEEKYAFMFHPSISSDLKLDLVLFMGQMIGMAVRSKITLDLSFPSYVWKVLVGESLTEKDLASFDKPAYEMMQQLLSLHQQHEAGAVEEDALETIRDLTWSATLSTQEVVELIPDGLQRPVLLPELGDYLTKYIERRFDETKQALRMFRKGLVSIIPESALSLLNAEDLQRLVCGSKSIDVERLQQNTEYDDDISPSDPHIQSFWAVLSEFSELERSAFLKFVWARPSLPPEGVEFTQKMRVLTATGEDGNMKYDQFLPKAHTCFFSINLPKYSTKEIMAEKLRYAIFNCAEMDGDFKTTEMEVAGWGATTLHSDMDIQANSMDFI